MLLANTIGRTNTVVQFLTVLLLFAFVVFITWFTTRWIAKLQKGQMNSAGSNMEVLENLRVAPDKFLQIVRVGKKYFVIGVGKSEINKICEISEDDIVFGEPDSKVGFAAVLEKFKNKQKEDEIQE